MDTKVLWSVSKSYHKYFKQSDVQRKRERFINASAFKVGPNSKKASINVEEDKKLGQIPQKALLSTNWKIIYVETIKAENNWEDKKSKWNSSKGKIV